MPDLIFEITGVEPAAHGMTPLLQFRLKISNTLATDTIQAIILHAQIQIQSAQRTYNAREKDRLEELFGTPERWGDTLRNRLWTNSHVCLGAFTGSTELRLAVPCTYDLNVAGTKRPSRNHRSAISPAITRGSCRRAGSTNGPAIISRSIPAAVRLRGCGRQRWPVWWTLVT